MILIDDRGASGQGVRELESKDQVLGSQTWIYDVPVGLFARCHYYQGEFTTEELNDRGFSVISFAQEFAGDSFHKQFDIGDMWKDKIKSRHFTEEEWECLLKEGFLGVIEMNYPELKENPTYVFCSDVCKKVVELEKEFHGRPFSELLGSVQEHFNGAEAEDKKVWECLNSAYKSPFILGEKVGNRIEFHDHYNPQKQQGKQDVKEDDEVR